ncbi:tripartite-type tricarboxylate transporter receptor subunit TctC [Cupriavidus alkaliphilus]|nr:tripartite-type tricarboxylate transporter receptor subunit TctC [Cupriavidus alkaliphilus]
MTAANPFRRQLLKASAALGACALAPTLARAQAWPAKPVRLVVPFAPGGSSEIVRALDRGGADQAARRIRIRREQAGCRRQYRDGRSRARR